MKFANRFSPLTIALVLLGCLFALSGPAEAKNNKHNKSHGKHHAEKGESHKRHGNHDDGFNVNVIIDRDRSLLLNHLESSRHCPPGLAKKHNGCLPPGQTKKYAPGMVVEPDVIWHPIPSELLHRLRPPPHGALYVQVDQNVLLVTEATRKVLDAVTLLSAIK